MASDIVPSSSAFATVAMKPDTDEEGNSLWSKNIADNTGYLFHRVGEGYKVIVQESRLLTDTIPENGKVSYIPFYKSDIGETFLRWAVYGTSTLTVPLLWTLGIIYNGTGTQLFLNKLVGTNGTLMLGSISTSGWGTGWTTATFIGSKSGVSAGTAHWGMALWLTI